ncbi:MAG TPA: hypothetical protein VHZ28_12550 [Terracidiphilus sp.]|nr:hypothetical protein [Terracidiphilus sp.]
MRIALAEGRRLWRALVREARAPALRVDLVELAGLRAVDLDGLDEPDLADECVLDDAAGAAASGD